MAKRSKNVLAAHRTAIQNADSGGADRVEYRVEGYPGLMLRCFATGQASWYAAYTIANGKRLITKRVKIADREAMDYTIAGGIAAKHVSDASQGKDPALEKQLRTEAITLGEMVQKRLDADELAGKLRETTVKQQRDLTKLLFNEVPGLSARQADKVSPAEMRLALQKLVGQGYSAKTRDLIKMALSAAYKWGQDKGYCEHNPVRDIRNSSQSKPRTNFASADNLKALWAACDDDEAPLSQDIRDIIRLALLVGQRRSEVALMRKAQLDAAAALWTLEGDRQEYRGGKTVTVHGATKNGHEQVVPLNEQALAIIRVAVARAGDRERLFAVTPGAVTMAMRRLREKYGIGDVTMHSLRRTISSWAGKQKDIRAEAIEALLNHQPRADDVTRRHYQQARLTDEVRDVLERWGKHVEAVVSGEAKAEAGAKAGGLRVLSA